MSNLALPGRDKRYLGLGEYEPGDPDYSVRQAIQIVADKIVGKHMDSRGNLDPNKVVGSKKYKIMRDAFINNRIKAMFDKEIKKTKPKTFQQLYSMIKFPQIPVDAIMRSFEKRHPRYRSEYINKQSNDLVKANNKQLQNREALLLKLNKDLGIPIPLEYIETGDGETLTKDAIEKYAGSVAVSSTGKQGTISLTEKEIEEVSAMAGGAVAMSPRKKRKVTENEVNEALNYLLQKLGV